MLNVKFMSLLKSPPITDPTIDDYKAAVENLAENKSEMMFRNSRSDLAAIVMATIIKYSKKEVRIYDNCLNGDIADQHHSFLEALRLFLVLGKKVKIVLQKEIECESIVCQKLSQYSIEYPKGLEIRLANDEFRSNIKEVMEKDIYFMVGDNFAYRMETTEDLDYENEMRAIFSFNGPEIASKLIKAFDKNYKSCRLIKLHQNSYA
jgi:hypothetical protein